MGMFHLSENVFVTAQNRVVFSIMALHGASNLATVSSDHVEAIQTRIVRCAVVIPANFVYFRFRLATARSANCRDTKLVVFKKNILSRKKVVSKNKISSIYKRYFVTVKKHFPPKLVVFQKIFCHDKTHFRKK